MAKVNTYDDVLRTIAANYEEIEHSIANQLLINVPSHYPTEGAYRENVWKSLFEMVVPRKYCIEQGVFIIDAFGHKSREVDLAVYDEIYTPYIFNYGEIKFIPIEAVAAVIQCKSRYLCKENIIDWVDSIDALITSMDSVARMAGFMADNQNVTKENSVTQTATRPLTILCTLATKKALGQYNDRFDIILSVDVENKKLYKSIKNEDQSLEAWNDQLNHAIDNIENSDDKEYRKKIKVELKTNRQAILKELKVSGKDEKGGDNENVILSLIFQLNQLLMVLNNPMLFPHHAYAQRFREALRKSSENKGEKLDEEQR